MSMRRALHTVIGLVPDRRTRECPVCAATGVVNPSWSDERGWVFDECGACGGRRWVEILAV